MVMIGFGPVLGGVTALLFAVLGVVSVSHRRQAADDTEARIDALTRKVRRRATIRSWFR